MTKKSSIRTSEIDQYELLDLHQLEAAIKQLQQDSPTPESKRATRAARQALKKRQRYIKARTMEFEQTNDHHLLLFDSTDNFSKIAGRSVLFYSLTIADRIHRRFSIKNDSDDYSKSPDGIISIRTLSQLESQLAEINIFPDQDLSTTELHFYKLPKVYNDEQIAKLRDRSHQDIERITSIIIPKSPNPNLYNLILEMNRLLYYNCKRVSDSLARDTLIHQLILDANEVLVSYLNFANAKPSSGIVHRELQASVLPVFNPKSPLPLSVQAQNLFNILLCSRNLRNNLANIENLRLIHHRELCDILEKLVEIERIATREYNKQLRSRSSGHSTETTSTDTTLKPSSAKLGSVINQNQTSLL